MFHTANPAFTTEEEREEFLHFYRGNPPGMAMAHARYYQLGIWGDRNALAKDCARILSIELACIHKRYDGYFDPDEFPPEQILKLRSFWLCFDEARKENEGQVNNVVRNLCLSQGNTKGAPRHQDTRVDDYVLEKARNVIYDEFMGVYLGRSRRRHD